MAAAATHADDPVQAPSAIATLELPPSSLLTAEQRVAAARSEAESKALRACIHSAGKNIAAIRKCVDQSTAATVDRQKALYKVRIESQTVAGVETEVFMPMAGVPENHRNKLLINLHGGGFGVGWPFVAQLESIPIAALGGYKVMSVNYRMAPEHKFPAAVEDVTALYRELLRSYEPGNIGVYGCSAGAVLTAEVVARIQKDNLPRPGAIGMLCAAAAFWGEGDSGYIGAAILGVKPDSIHSSAYFQPADPNDPLVFPARSPEVLARFPPSLLVSSTRDKALSSVVFTHSQLVKLGVKAELHVWEGLGHGFFSDPDLPQSREVYDVVVSFFNSQLGR
jgi:acetyl esterase/lipase